MHQWMDWWACSLSLSLSLSLSPRTRAPTHTYWRMIFLFLGRRGTYVYIYMIWNIFYMGTKKIIFLLICEPMQELLIEILTKIILTNIRFSNIIFTKRDYSLVVHLSSMWLTMHPLLEHDTTPTFFSGLWSGTHHWNLVKLCRWSQFVHALFLCSYSFFLINKCDVLPGCICMHVVRAGLSKLTASHI